MHHTNKETRYVLKLRRVASRTAHPAGLVGGVSAARLEAEAEEARKYLDKVRASFVTMTQR